MSEISSCNKPDLNQEYKPKILKNSSSKFLYKFSYVSMARGFSTVPAIVLLCLNLAGKSVLCLAPFW